MITVIIRFIGGIIFDGHLEVTNQSRQLIQSTDYDHGRYVSENGCWYVYLSQRNRWRSL